MIWFPRNHEEKKNVRVYVLSMASQELKIVKSVTVELSPRIDLASTEIRIESRALSLSRATYGRERESVHRCFPLANAASFA